MPNHFITLNTASALTSHFRTNKESMLTSSLRNNGTLPECETFDRVAFETLLEHEECKSIRIYLAMDTSDKVRLIIVGVDKDDHDILPADPDSLTAAEKIVEDGFRCPTTCPPASALNS